MPRLRSAVRGAVLLAMLPGCALAPPALVDLVRPGPAEADAWLLFQRHCRSCHGALGAGDGPYAAAFRAPAPDLLELVRAWPDRQTDDLVGRILHGRQPATPGEDAMPAFADVLDPREGRAIVAMLAALAADLDAEGTVADGAAVFHARCATCHGTDGAGAGPLAAELVPAPRDLTRAWYRFRSTPSGAGPRRSDLARSIASGLGVTAMSGFRALGRERIAALTTHLSTLTTVVAEDVAASSPPAADADLARGKALYDDARCWQCHGTEGRGDGPSARELRDDAGQASLPANLRRSWRLKGGADGASLARTIATGMNGTPMPSYGEVLEADELWALARYVGTLGEPRPHVPAALPVHTLTGMLADDPAASFWRAVPATRLPLGPQAFVPPRWHRPAIDVVEVRVGWSDEAVAFHLTWDDAFEDRSAEDRPTTSVDDPARAGRWRLPDQAALRLTSPAPGATLPPLGETGPDAAVVRWTWAADEPPVPAPAGRNARPTPSHGVARARAVFADGRWRAVWHRSRADPEVGALFVPGTELALSLQLWDGSSGEDGSRHALSSWVPFTVPDR